VGGGTEWRPPVASAAGGEEQETIQTRSRSAVRRGPSATRLRSFPSAYLSRMSRDVARVTTDANERPFALGRLGARQALHPIFFSPPNSFDDPALRKTNTPTNKHLSRARNSRVQEIQPFEMPCENAGSVWIRGMVTVSIPVTMRVTSTVTMRVGIFGERKISSPEMPGCASRLLCAAGRSVCGSHRSGDAASCAAWLGQGRGRDATAMMAPPA